MSNKTARFVECRGMRNSLLAFVSLSVSVFCGSVSAGVTVDQQPLVIARPLPPNIMFILDDSGSMAWDFMPGATTGDAFSDYRAKTYTFNTLYYNPHVTYLPWVTADGSQMANANRTAVSTSNTNLTGSVNLTSSNQCFHELRSPTSDPSNSANYYKYVLRSGGTQARRCDSASSSCGDSGCTNISSFTWTSSNGKVITRTIAEEWQNYANWYHYYRTRAKMAKASVSRAFSNLGEDFRVGFRTIRNRNTFDIPVQSDDGLFRGKNREDWYLRLFNATANGGTPLREALGTAGEYFKDTSSNGPYGPGSKGEQLSCRQNFSILTTDGYWNGNAAAFAEARADNDSNEGVEITGPNGSAYKYSPTRPYRDGRSNTLADVAMYYWKTDLRPDLKNDVPISSSNPAFWQHMTTFGISIGEKGVLDPTRDLPGLTNGSLSWPQPGDDRQANIDDLWHAALNSRGEFVVASDPDAFAKALSNALDAIGGRLGSGTALAANSTKLETGTTTFQAQYFSANWSGDLKAYAINATTGAVSAEPIWSANALIPGPASRTIKFYSSSGAYADFIWSSLNASQKAALANDENVLKYIRGERKLEEPAGRFRARDGVLGTIVHSQPVFVGKPNPRLFVGAHFTGAEEYPAFAAAQSSRTPVVYVGANDGMLHGFDAATGVEKYAFIPSAAFDHLASYVSPDYKHRYVVDGEITVADVYKKNNPGRGWKTVLVGTMGRGGKAVFALDVTDPNNVKFLWEKSSASFGNVLGKPIIAQVADGDWRVILGNGPNSTGDKARLLMIGVEDGVVTELDTGVAGNNGLSAVYTWDSDGDGFVDTAYAGDFQGNLWRFSGLASSPSVSALFEARDENDNPQPITAAPLAGKNPKTGDLWVFFGTGRYLNSGDAQDSSKQSWYGLIDNGTQILGRAQLKQRKILAEGVINGFDARVIESPKAGDMADKRGWYIDLTAARERMVVPNQFVGNVLIGTSRIPDTSDPCNPTGRGFVMAIDPFSGGRLPDSFFDFTLDGFFTDSDKLLVDGKYMEVSGIGFNSSPNNPLFMGGGKTGGVMIVGLEDGTQRKIDTQVFGAEAGRLSWREILQ